MPDASEVRGARDAPLVEVLDDHNRIVRVKTVAARIPKPSTLGFADPSDRT
jgi:hypothetical protein